MNAIYEQLAKSAINSGDFGAPKEMKISRVFPPGSALLY